MTARRLRVTLLGTGSSGGVPRVGNDWGVCDPSEPKNRRLRCSILVELFASHSSDPTRIVVDTSPDFRQQLLSAHVDRLDAVVISHDHADQTHGLDDVRALAIRARAQMPVHMDSFTAETLIRKFAYCFEGKGDYPPILSLQPFLTEYAPRTINGSGGGLTLLPLLQEHGRIRSLGFRFADVAYCNDLNGLPDRTLSELTALDVLIIDALRYTPHPTHAHLEQTLGWIDTLKPKRAILTNLHIDMDYQTLLSELPEGVEPGFDGLSIEATA